jgi:hypothetical protein
MTERTRAGAGWGALTLVAPAAAVGLAAATGWAVAHPPTTASTPAPAPGSVSTGREVPDKPLARLQQQALAERARVVRLQRRLDRVAARTATIRRLPAPDSGVVAPPPPVTSAPGAAPQTHTSTGAS